MSYGYEEALARRAASTTLSSAGSSGYFAQRGQTLDPALFERLDHLRPDVRLQVLDTLYSFWIRKGYRNPQGWSQVWLAGSGITTAWDADREAGGAPGDLDSLIGVDYTAFAHAHPGFAGSTPHDIAHYLNQQMFNELWPTTARIHVGGRLFELTYYINGGVGTGSFDLRVIEPYAAYNLNVDKWVVHPVNVSADFSDSYFTDADRSVVAKDQVDVTRANEVYGAALTAYNTAENVGVKRNMLSNLHEAVQAGAAVYDRIHDGRRAAFSPGGKGYFDPANYRWQAGKLTGVVTLARGFKQLDEASHRDLAAPCSNYGHLLLLASLANGGS